MGETNSELPPGISQAEIDAHVARVEASETASSKPFPGPMREAFASQPRVVLGYTLQPVTCALISALERIDSKFIDMVEIIREMHGKPPEEISKEIASRLNLKSKDLVATAFCFVTPIDDLEELIEKMDKAKFERHALKTLGRRLGPVQLGTLNTEIIGHYLESFSTALKYEGKSDGNFTPPPPEPKTASVGG